MFTVATVYWTLTPVVKGRLGFQYIHLSRSAMYDRPHQRTKKWAGFLTMKIRKKGLKHRKSRKVEDKV